IYRGEYPADIVADIRAVDADAVAQFESAVRDGDLETISQRIDTQGVNYYHGDLLAGTAPEHPPVSGGPATERTVRSPYPSNAGIHAVERGLPRTAQNWEIQPEGLTRLLRRLSDEYTAERAVVLYVTENGAAFDDVVSED